MAWTTDPNLMFCVHLTRTIGIISRKCVEVVVVLLWRLSVLQWRFIALIKKLRENIYVQYHFICASEIVYISYNRVDGCLFIYDAKANLIKFSRKRPFVTLTIVSCFQNLSYEKKLKCEFLYGLEIAVCSFFKFKCDCCLDFNQGKSQ